MYSNFSFTNQQTFFQKLRSIDYLLLICILLVGSISCFAMYSTDGGEVLYHTKNHAIRFALFFTLMLVISFINIKMWFSLSYLFYGVTLILLLWASLYGITASGSQRWINLYFINLQPSEIMKIAIIVCFAKYYHRAQIHSINKFTNIFVPLVILIIPIFLVITQPDLGTSILIALSGIMVLWLAGINIKYFVIASITFVISAPFIISFLKPYQKLNVDNYFLNKKVVITGTLNNFTRDEIKTKLNSLGSKFVSQVSKNIDLVIYGENPGSKLSKAQELNIKMIDEKKLNEILDKL